MFRELVREVEKRPLIPFSFGGVIGLCVSVYFGRKLVKDIEKRENGS